MHLRSRLPLIQYIAVMVLFGIAGFLAGNEGTGPVVLRRLPRQLQRGAPQAANKAPVADPGECKSLPRPVRSIPSN